MRLVTNAALAALSIVVLALVLVVRAPAWRSSVDASTCLLLGVDDLVERADLAYEARVTSKSTTVDVSGRIATDYALSVERTFVGEARATRTVRVPGGVLPDGRGLALPGLPKWNVGETAIVFLARENRHAERMPIGLAQGSLSVKLASDGTKTLESDLRDLEIVDAQGKPVAGVPAVRRLAYADTVARIESACARRARKLEESRK